MVIRLILLVLYSIPYGFLAVNGDANSGTVIYYFLMIIIFWLLCRYSIKSNNIIIIFIGIILSYYNSYNLWDKSNLRAMNYYFKPFTAETLIRNYYIIALILQIIMVIYKRKNKS